MKRHFAKLIRAGRIGRATILLIVLGVFLIAGTTALFLNLLERHRSIVESVREDAMWAVFQTDREASRLIEAIYIAEADPTADALARLRFRFDLVYSRGNLLKDGMFTEKFSESGDIQAYADATQAAISAMADLIDPLSGQDEQLRQRMPEVRAQAEDIRSETTRLVLRTNEALDALRVAERNLTSEGYSRLAKGVAVMTFVFVSIVALQFRQLAQISKTERKLWHLSLRNARTAKAAQAASDAKTRFLATMSHEIRTPLNGIIGAADLLKDSLLSTEQQKRVSTIRSSGTLLLDVITDILDYSKLEADAVAYTYAPVRLSDIAMTLKTVMKPRAEEANLRFNVSLPDCQIVTDAVRLRQVLVNLVGNAIKFTREGGITITGVLKDKETLRVTVSDTGVGISEANQAHLFKDFSQIDNSASRHFDGTGLGLAISKRIITGMGGQIGVTSQEGKGSDFWFELPVRDIKCTAHAAEEVSQETARVPDHFHADVLVVEDNEVNREVATAILERLGVHVEIATNGQEAIDILETTSFDLIFMDLQMPVLDGISATIAIRQMGLAVPIVGLTANAFEDDRKRCLDVGMDDFATKPITADRIRDVLARFAKPAAESSEAGEHSRALIDADQMASIVEHTGKESYLRMLEKLRSDVDAAASILAETGGPQSEDDRDTALHTIKGAALTLGLESLGHLAQDMRGADKVTAQSPRLLVSVAQDSIEAASRRFS